MYRWLMRSETLVVKERLQLLCISCSSSKGVRDQAGLALNAHSFRDGELAMPLHLSLAHLRAHSDSEAIVAVLCLCVCSVSRKDQLVIALPGWAAVFWWCVAAAVPHRYVLRVRCACALQHGGAAPGLAFGAGPVMFDNFLGCVLAQSLLCTFWSMFNRCVVHVLQ